MTQENQIERPGFTPGPWRAGRPDTEMIVDGWESKWVYDSRDQYVAVASERIDGEWEEVMANAHLIAAAPEMYTLLRDFLDNYEFGDDADAKITAVLDKAEGSSKGGSMTPRTERAARWDGCTHEKCEECGNIIERGWCRTCREKRELEKWVQAERKPWDGATPLYSDSHDKYFFEDDMEEYAEDKGVSLDDLRLYICEPQYGRPIDSDYFRDELPEDGEVPDVLLEAMDVLNEAIRKAGPLSWYPGKYVPILSAPPDVPNEREIGDEK